jgi:hypothetical protein
MLSLTLVLVMGVDIESAVRTLHEGVFEKFLNLRGG